MSKGLRFRLRREDPKLNSEQTSVDSDASSEEKRRVAAGVAVGFKSGGIASAATQLTNSTRAGNKCDSRQRQTVQSRRNRKARIKNKKKKLFENHNEITKDIPIEIPVSVPVRFEICVLCV